MSNVVDNETGRPLGSGKRTHTMVHNGIKVGLMGLVEKEWLDTLPTIDIKEGSSFQPFKRRVSVSRILLLIKFCF